MQSLRDELEECFETGSSVVVIRASDVNITSKRVEKFFVSKGGPYHFFNEDEVLGPSFYRDSYLKENRDNLENPQIEWRENIRKSVLGILKDATTLNLYIGRIEIIASKLHSPTPLLFCGVINEFALSYRKANFLRDLEMKGSSTVKLVLILNDKHICENKPLADMSPFHSSDSIDIAELGEIVPVIRSGYPTGDELLKILKNTLRKMKTNISDDDLKAIAKGSVGISSISAPMIFRSVLTKHLKSGYINPESVIRDIKVKNQTNLPEALKPATLTSEDSTLGGMKGFKEWVLNAKTALSEEAEQFGIPSPKGLVLVGPPGTGKSKACRYLASTLGLPMYELQIFGLLSRLISEGERNAVAAFDYIDGLGPCVIVIDEIEKMFANTRSGFIGAHESSKRLLGQLLTWLSDRKSKAIIVATSNSTLELPVETLRYGRFDKVFYVGLPDFPSRKEILVEHLNRAKKRISEEDADEIARLTQGMSGAEISGVVIEAIKLAFTRDKILMLDDFIKAIEKSNCLVKDAPMDLADLCFRGMRIGKLAGTLSEFETEILEQNKPVTNQNTYDSAYT